MNLEIVPTSFLTGLVRTVCLTFLHSLWQGLAVAVLAGVFLMLTRQSSPALRYNVLVALLAILIVANASTFFFLLPEKQSLPEGTVWVAATSRISEASAGSALPVFQTFTGSIVNFCTQHAGTILTLWLAVFLWKSMQAAMGLVHLRKLTTRGTYPPANAWRDVFADLTRKLGIRQHIRFFESGYAAVPMVVGYMKPVVLVPLGMLAGMPPEQVEAILLHELAHIRRRDYLVNLVQIFCENVYFFNPAVVWLSHLIREEREHCCDDLAIRVSANRTSFIHALVSFQEYSLSVQSGSVARVAFAGKRNHLLDRITRIINHNNKSLDAMEKVFVSVSLVAAIALSAAVSPQSPQSVKSAAPDQQRIDAKADLRAEHVEPVIPALDTLPKKKPGKSLDVHAANVYGASEGVSTYNVTFEGRKYEYVRKKGRIISLDVDGREIPENEFDQYKDALARIEEHIRTEHEKAEKQRAEAEQFRAQADVHRKEAEQTRLEAEKHRAEADEYRQHAASLRVQAEQERLNAEQMRKQAEAMRIQADQLRKEAEKMRVEADKQRAAAEVQRQEAEKTREEFEKKQSALINELLQAGIIRDTKDLSYLLSGSELIVNGVKQPAELQKRMSAKYLGGENAEMVYNYKGRSGYTITGKVYTR